MKWFERKDPFVEVKKQMDAGEYAAAACEADKIPDNKVKEPADLLLLAKVYRCSGDYPQAKTLLLRAYDKRPLRSILLELMDCCLETKELAEVETYFDRYQRLAPNDMTTLYIYRYKIEKSKGRDLALLITILEDLKATDYREEYAYELAKLYHKSGRREECMAECEELILWFGEGAIVERAKALLAYYKGEIGLEEIKEAGKRYVEGQRSGARAAETKKEKNVNSVREETDLSGSREETSGASEEESGTVLSNQAASFEDKKAVSGSEGSDRADTLSREEEPWDGELPVIDLSDIDFSDVLAEGEALEENLRAKEAVGARQQPERPTEKEEVGEAPEEEEVWYGPRSESGYENLSGKLAALLKKQQVSLEELCRNFFRIESVRRQILLCLEEILDEKDEGCLLITGGSGSGKTALAFDMVNVLCRMGLIDSDRTAVTDAARLSGSSLAANKKALSGRSLIVEHAGELTKEAIAELQGFGKRKAEKSYLVFEDTEQGINRLLRGEGGKLRRTFHRIDLPAYGVRELFGFAWDGIQKEDYEIEKHAALVLKERMEQIVRTEAEENRLPLAMQLVRNAIECAQERSSGKILRMAASGRFESGNFSVLTAEDIPELTDVRP